MATIFVNGRKIKEIRQNLGLTKRRLGQMTGISVSVLSRIEQIGKTSEPTLKKLADAFGCKPSDFLIQEIGPRAVKYSHIEESLRMGLDASTIAYCLSDLDGYVSYMNKGALELWGYGRLTEVKGKHCVELFFNKGTALKVFDTVRKTGGWIGELMVERNDESTVKVIATVSMVLDEKDQACCVMASFIKALDIVRHGTILDTSKADLDGSSEGNEMRRYHF